MAYSPLTLAALASSAVPSLDIAKAAHHGETNFDSAVITERSGARWLVRVALNEQAKEQESREIIALRALSQGVRARLAFTLPTLAGETTIKNHRVAVYPFLDGEALPETFTEKDYPLIRSLARAIASIHSLPTKLLTDAKLTVHQAEDAHQHTRELIDRVITTGLVPGILAERWGKAIADQSLWQFTPVTVHGALTGTRLHVIENRIAAISGWHNLHVGDPASDLFWARTGKMKELAEKLMSEYLQAATGKDRGLPARTTLLAELELARWLLHGITTQENNIVEDAVAMMSKLSDSIHHEQSGEVSRETAPILTITEVETLLGRAEHR